MNYLFIQDTFTYIGQHDKQSVACFFRRITMKPFTLGIILLFLSISAGAQTLPAAVQAVPLAMRPASAAPQNIGNIVQPYGSYTFTGDDNMLRFRDHFNPNSIPDEKIRERAERGLLFDFSHRFTGGLKFNKTLGRQYFTADGNWTHNRFEYFDSMNNNLKSANGNLNWFLGNRLEGNIGGSYMQSLAPFIFLSGIKTIRTEQSAYFDGAWNFHPSWSANFGYRRYDLVNDSPSTRLQFLNRTEDRFESGIDFHTTQRNSIGVLYRHTIGNFPVRVIGDDGSLIDNSYNFGEALAKIVWNVSAKSRFQWTGGWVMRNYVDVTQRNFSGFNARLNFTWQPTDKIDFKISGWRETLPAQQLTASHSLNTGVSAMPTWIITPKLRLLGNFSYEDRNFTNIPNITDPLPIPIAGHNKLLNASTQLVYTPYLGLQLGISAYHSSLQTENPIGGFSATGGTISLQYTYGRL